MSNEKYKQVQQIAKIINNGIDADITDAQKKKYRFNKTLMEEGIKCARSGLSLDDIPAELLSDDSFIIGYEKGIRLLNIDDDFFEKGAKAYFEGVSLEDIPESDRQNELFLLGYEDAMMMGAPRKR